MRGQFLVAGRDRTGFCLRWQFAAWPSSGFALRCTALHCTALHLKVWSDLLSRGFF